MRHADDETLSLLALGEPAPADLREHLEKCALCSGELAELRGVVMTARAGAGSPDVTVGTPAPPVAPPPAVWEAIQAATGVSTAARAAEVERHAHPAGSNGTAASVGADRAHVVDAFTGGGSTGQPRRRRRRMRRATALTLAAAALVVGALAGGSATYYLTDRSQPAARPIVVAATSLAGLPLAPAAAGRADVVETSDGRVLDVDVSRLANPEGFYEVWLIDPTVTKMVAVGVLSGDTGRFTLPEGVDLAGYPIVDVSVQPLDGDPKHSGRSVLRGTLRS